MFRIKPSYFALALVMLMPGPAHAACTDEVSKLDDALARYNKKSDSCSLKTTTDISASIRKLDYSCSKSPGTGRLQRYSITATVDRATGCDVVIAISEKRQRNTSTRGLCRKGGPCNHGNYARP